MMTHGMWREEWDYKGRIVVDKEVAEGWENLLLSPRPEACVKVSSKYLVSSCYILMSYDGDAPEAIDQIRGTEGS